MITENVASRLRRTGWRELVLPELRRLGLDAQSSQSNSAPSPPPWIVFPAVPTFKTDVSKMEPTATQLSAAIQYIAERGQADLQLVTDGSPMEGTTNGCTGLIIMAGGSIIHRWHAPTSAQSSSFQAEKTVMQAATAWLEECEDWHKALLTCDCKSLVDAVGTLLAPDEGIRLVQAAVARLNAERCLEVLRIQGHCGLQDNELADEEAKLGSAGHQSPVRLDCATHRAVIRRACSTQFIYTPLHTATLPSNLVP